MMNFEEQWKVCKTFGILQKKEEFRELLNILRLHLIKYDNYLEIGTNNGGTD